MAGEQPKKVAGGAFGQYLTENRAALFKELPGQPATATVKLASERFKALDDVAKAKYQRMYEAAKQKYEEDLAAFLSAGGQMKVRKSKKGDIFAKKSKDPNKPKQPAGGAFGCFLAAKRAEFTKELGPGISITAVTKHASQRWKEVSEAEKVPFQKEFEEKMAQYKKSMETYVPPAGEEENDEDEGELRTPKKKKKTYIVGRLTPNTSQPTAKRRRTLTTLDVDASALAEAQQLGLESQFMEFACSPVVLENGVMLKRGAGARVLFRILKGVNGDVEAAKKKFEKKMQASQRIPN